jgi:hypothetical protein
LATLYPFGNTDQARLPLATISSVSGRLAQHFVPPESRFHAHHVDSSNQNRCRSKKQHILRAVAAVKDGDDSSQRARDQHPMSHAPLAASRGITLVIACHVVSSRLGAVYRCVVEPQAYLRSAIESSSTTQHQTSNCYISCAPTEKTWC